MKKDQVTPYNEQYKDEYYDPYTDTYTNEDYGDDEHDDQYDFDPCTESIYDPNDYEDACSHVDFESLQPIHETKGAGDQLIYKPCCFSNQTNGEPFHGYLYLDHCKERKTYYRDKVEGPEALVCGTPNALPTHTTPIHCPLNCKLMNIPQKDFIVDSNGIMEINASISKTTKVAVEKEAYHTNIIPYMTGKLQYVNT